jgi:molybdate transport system permease protein
MTAPTDWFPLWLSLRVAGLATLIAVLFGVALAYLLARHHFPGRAVVEAMTSLPLALPPTVLGYYLLVVVGREGVLGAWLENSLGITLVFTWEGAVLAAAIPSLPLVVRPARAALEDVDREMLEAARIDGAGPLQELVRILLPLARRGIIAGVALGFVRALGDFGTTLMVAGNIPGRTQTMPIALFDAVQAGRWELAGVLALLLSVVSVVVLVVVARLGERAL